MDLMSARCGCGGGARSHSFWTGCTTLTVRRRFHIFTSCLRSHHASTTSPAAASLPMLQTSSAIAMAPVHGAELPPKQILHPRVMTLGMQHLPCFAQMTSEAFTSTNQRAFGDKTAQSGVINTLRYPKAKAINNDPKAANNNERRAQLEPTGAPVSSQCAPAVVGGGRHFLSAYRRFFDNPEAHLFPTDYTTSPGQAAAAAALQRASGGGDGLQSPSKGIPRVLGSPPPSFASKSHQTHTEFEPEYLHQHPLRTFTTSGFTALTQDRCYRTARAEGVPVSRGCALGDGVAYIRDGSGGYVVADVATAPVTSKSVKAHDHMFGAVQVTDDAALFLGDSGGNPVPRRAQNLPPVSSGFVTSSAAHFTDPSVPVARLNEVAQQRTAAVLLDGSVPRTRDIAFTLPGIFHRVNGISTIVREKEVMYQMRVAKGQVQAPPRAKITSISLEHEPFSVPVCDQ